jgi:hypothetical protein
MSRGDKSPLIGRSLTLGGFATQEVVTGPGGRMNKPVVEVNEGLQKGFDWRRRKLETIFISPLSSVERCGE